VRVAIVGVGNCAISFVQGVEYYKTPTGERRPRAHARRPGRLPRPGHRVHRGLRHRLDKVGKDLGEAIWSGQNNTMKFAEVPEKLGVKVHRGMTHDGLGKYLKQRITKAPGETADIVSILKETQTDVVVSYLPVGSEQATKWYVEQILEAGCGFVNCIPSSSPARTTGASASARPACRSSATTSSRRSAPRSCTARSPACSTSAA
jgi:myo-inositol-1-phosphate synthase